MRTQFNQFVFISLIKRIPFDPPTGSQQEVLLGMGCFWGAERLLKIRGRYLYSVGYGGDTQ